MISSGAIIAGLNDRQSEAVLDDSDALMIVAGAGSGKTRTLTHKIAHIIDNRLANPWEILSITFTNKAAGEMRDRLDGLLGDGVAKYVWASTFHSMCVRILRKFHDYLGLSADFTIYDADDSLHVIKDCMKELNIDDKRYKPRAFRSEISNLKNELKDVQTNAKIASASSDYYEDIKHKVYALYEQRKSELGALDFDDLIMQTVVLFETKKEVLEHYQKKIKYVLVDEYQDTNHAQYCLISLLVNAKPKSLKLVVVGDSDQSIYAFRGATIRNIEEFVSDFPGARKIVLDQNYRSVNNILKTANAVISENDRATAKELWSDRGDGEKVQGYTALDSNDEGEFVAKQIHKLKENGAKYGDIAVFFRTNAASRVLEEKLIHAGIPYKLVGGTKFYDRAEIKDMLAYLQIMLNPHDDVHLLRVLNVPRRGIGKTTADNVLNYARSRNISFYSALLELGNITTINNAAKTRLYSFCSLLQELTAFLDGNENPHLSEVVEKVIDRTGYLVNLHSSNDPQDRVRGENVQELVSAAAAYKPLEEINIDDIPEDASFEDIIGEGEDENDARITQIESALESIENPLGRAGLTSFLEHISLISDQDSVPKSGTASDESENDENNTKQPDLVLLMTLHTAKGLEFDYVFLTNFDDKSLPHTMSQNSETEIAEERRLAYVGITRARQRLFITYPKSKIINGMWDRTIRSRFLANIQEDLIEWSKSDKTFNRGGDLASTGGGWRNKYYSKFSKPSAESRTFGSGKASGYSKAAPKLNLEPFGIDDAFDPFAGEATVNSSSKRNSTSTPPTINPNTSATTPASHPLEAQHKVSSPSEGGFGFLRNRRKY